MATTNPKKRTTTRSSARKSTTRRRASKPSTAVSDANDTSSPAMNQKRNLGSGVPEQLMITIAAIVFGLVGLFVHVLFVVSLVLMALLLGMLASEARNQRGRGIVTEIVNEAKLVLEDVKKPGVASSDHATVEPSAESD